MNALTLAEYLDRHIHIAAMHDECANKLRRQHEAILKLREALETVSDGDIYLPPITRSIVLEALKDTEEFQ